MTSHDRASAADLKHANVLFLTRQNGDLFEKLSEAERNRDLITHKKAQIFLEIQDLTTAVDAANRKCHSLLISSLTLNEKLSESEIDTKGLLERNSLALNIAEQLELKKSALSDGARTRVTKMQALAGDEREWPKTRSRYDGELESKKSQISGLEESLKSERADVAALRQQLTRTESQASVDIELIRSNIGLIDKKNAGILEAVQRAEQLAISEGDKINQTKSALVEVSRAQKQLRSELDSVLSERSEFINERTRYQQKLQQVTNVHQSNKALLAAKEQELAALGKSRRDYDARLRELRDKEYSLLDQIRQSQVELSKLTQEASQSRKKLNSAKTVIASTQTRLSALDDSVQTLSAEIADLRAKNRETERVIASKADKYDTVSVSILKREKELADLTKALDPAQAKHREFALDVEALEQQLAEQSGRLERDRASYATAALESDRVLFDLTNASEEYSRLIVDLDSLAGELNRIKRVNADTKRHPALIDSDSPLLDRLHINPFLKEAQSAAQPIPLLVTKIAELVGLVGDSQNKADEALLSLQKRNAGLSAQRLTSVSLCDERIALSHFKQQAVEKYTRNELETDSETHALNLDSLMLVAEDISLLLETIKQAGGRDRVVRLSLRSNLLDDGALQVLTQLLYELSYLGHLDLRGNAFTDKTSNCITVQLRSMDGITAVDTVSGTPASPVGPNASFMGVLLEGRSGKVKRISIDLRDPRSVAPSGKPGPAELLPPEALKSAETHLERTTIREPPKALSRPSKVAVDVPIVRGPALKSTPTEVPTPPRPTLSMKHAPQTSSAFTRRLSVPNPMSSRESVVSDASFVRQLDVSRRQIKERAVRLGIKSLPFT